MFNGFLGSTMMFGEPGNHVKPPAGIRFVKEPQCVVMPGFAPALDHEAGLPQRSPFEQRHIVFFVIKQQGGLVEHCGDLALVSFDSNGIFGKPRLTVHVDVVLLSHPVVCENHGGDTNLLLPLLLPLLLQPTITIVTTSILLLPLVLRNRSTTCKGVMWMCVNTCVVVFGSIMSTACVQQAAERPKQQAEKRR
jgi:hypothetical protein